MKEAWWESGERMFPTGPKTGERSVKGTGRGRRVGNEVTKVTS